ncbi:hypothetical protein ABD87_22810 [Lysinibacillus sphaericus]|uniref:hypothetical protein n=1 Tax=Lysinibacillus sphaericus TaxID=1421 RepID=UPI0018CF5249|nr:hypothetical protein [Lysinibacillus sphaericus]MBG9732259.1 hypothetical protein [Lysinibacillus sphaericus]
MEKDKIVLLAPHTRIMKYINEVKKFLGNSDYTKIKNERIERFRALLSEDNELLNGQLRGKIKKIVNHIIYTTCVGGISTTSAKSLSEIGGCSESTVYRAVKLIKESKQFIVGNENEYGKGRYIFVDTLCVNYPIVMEYVFQLHETIYKSLAYDHNVQGQANHELSKVFGINKDDEVGMAIEQLSRSNRLGNYVSFYELKQYNQGLLKASDILGSIRSRIMSVLNLQRKAIEYQQPTIYALYDLMVGTSARLDLLESIPKIIVKLLQLTKDKPSIKDVLRTYKAYAEMAKNFAKNTKMMYQQHSLPRYFEVVYEAFKAKEETVENSLKDVNDLSHDLGVVQEQVDSFIGVCRNELKPKDTPPKFYNWLVIRD